MSSQETWVFAYGSLIWRPGFEPVVQLPGVLTGWSRRFHQGSPDHRGTPEQPGRVVTLVEAPGARCEGHLLQLPAATAPAILQATDVREQGGYERLRLRVESPAGTVDAWTWVAHSGNPWWLGDAPLSEMAAHIARAHGPSGTNRAYLLQLRDALAAANVEDLHVQALALAVEALG